VRRGRRAILAGNLAAATLLAALAGAQEPAAEPRQTSEPSTDVDAAAGPERNAYFGELHIHSSWSIDAYVFGTRIGPEDATRYAMGQPVAHSGGYDVKLAQPLDFTVVMDHSEYTGALTMANDPQSPLRKNAPFVANLLRFGTWADGMLLYKLLSVSIVKSMPITTLQGPDGAEHAWNQIAGIAEKYNRPGTFTTFPGWEWTSTPDYKNLHRIVFFKDAKRVSATEFSSIDSTRPEALWDWMAAQRKAGNDVIAITHNGNLSNGALYPRAIDSLGQPIDRAYAETRMRNEPVSEVAQVKGQSETTPFLSPDDELADFNVFVWLLLGAKGVPTDYGSYMRLALRDGIAMQGALGFNPYKFGMVAGSDSHSAASAYRQDDYFGEHGAIDDSVDKRLSSTKILNMDNREVCTAGLTGVWAEENTRQSIWDAIWRKETYATSGLRMKVRLFGGWAFDPAVFDQPDGQADWARVGYAQGVPMGSDLPAPSAQAPSFLLWAASDPTGPNLDRLQIVKGWAKDGQTFERVYDVAWSGDRTLDPATGKLPAIRSTADVSKGTYANTIGSTQLEKLWTDPDFDPSLDAFYYARAVLIPAPRWTTIQAVKQGMTPPDVVPPVVQDRAWSSPIWYTPSAEARRAGHPGTTVAALLREGAKPLDDAALQDTIVGKKIRVHNLVTGDWLEFLYDASGKRLVSPVDRKTRDAAIAGDRFFDREAAYEIHDGRIVTTLDGTPFEMTLYAFGDRYIAARSDEYGYANYEISF